MTLGLWGTPDPERVAVTAKMEDPEAIIGFVREIHELRWAVEGDPNEYVFSTPREAAEYGYNTVWQIKPSKKLNLA